jgi:hypothetical protein
MRAGILVAITAVLLPALPAEAKRHSCAAKHSKTAVRDRRVRIFYSDRGGLPEYRACFYRDGRRRRFTTGNEDGLGEIRLRTPYVAWVELGSGSGTTFETLYSGNLRTGRSRELASFYAPQGPYGRDLRGLVLSETGSVAWISDSYGLGPDNQQHHDVAVLKRDADGRGTLDPGPTVDPDSLALSRSGRRVYWTNAGEPRSARLR